MTLTPHHPQSLRKPSANTASCAERLQAVLGACSLLSPTTALATLLSSASDQYAQELHQAQVARPGEASTSLGPGGAPPAVDPQAMGSWLRQRFSQLMNKGKEMAQCLLSDVPRSLLEVDTASNAQALLQVLAAANQAPVGDNISAHFKRCELVQASCICVEGGTTHSRSDAMSGAALVTGCTGQGDPEQL